MTDQLRLAVVGMGAVARAVHLPILTRRSDRFVVVGLCDLVAEAVEVAGDRFGIPETARFTDLEEMLDTVEAEALAVLSSGSHTPEILSGLARELPVFCEKPLAYTRREAADIADALSGRSNLLMVGYMKAHDPAVIRAGEVARERPRPRSVEVTVLHPSAGSQLAHSEIDPNRVDPPDEVADRLTRSARALEREALGPAADQIGPVYSELLLGSLVHDLAVLRTVGLRLDRVDRVERWPAGIHPPSVAVLGATADDVRISMRWHYLARHPAYREEIRWHDEEGTIELTFPAPYLLRAPTVLRVTSGDGTGVHERISRSTVEAFEEELVVFHDMATTGAPPPNGFDEGLDDIMICQQMAVRLAESEGLAVGGEAGARGASRA